MLSTPNIQKIQLTEDGAIVTLRALTTKSFEFIMTDNTPIEITFERIANPPDEESLLVGCIKNRPNIPSPVVISSEVVSGIDEFANNVLEIYNNVLNPSGCYLHFKPFIDLLEVLVIPKLDLNEHYNNYMLSELDSEKPDVTIKTIT